MMWWQAALFRVPVRDDWTVKVGRQIPSTLSASGREVKKIPLSDLHFFLQQLKVGIERSTSRAERLLHPSCCLPPSPIFPRRSLSVRGLILRKRNEAELGEIRLILRYLRIANRHFPKGVKSEK
jgi:hypothetical protein